MGIGEPQQKTSEKKLVEKGTGKEVITEPPHKSFKWKDGYVLVKTEDTEGGPYGSAVIGGDAFHWMPKEEVQTEEEK